MAIKISRVYARCQRYLEEAKGMLQKNKIEVKIKLIEIGDSICKTSTKNRVIFKATTSLQWFISSVR